MTHRLIHILLSLLVLTAIPTAGAKERFYRNISETGDFGALTISTIYQDSTGYVWMGSDHGVLRCDGIHTRLIPLDVAGGDRPLFITSFSSLPRGKIAVGTRRGLFIIDGRGSISGDPDNSPEITSLVRWAPDTLLAGTVHGLAAYDSDGYPIAFPRLPVANIYSPQAHIMCMAADSDGNIYLHTLTALYRLNRSTRAYTLLYEQPSYSDRAIDMAVSPGRVWIAMMSSGLWVVDTDTGTASQVEINSPVVTSLSMSPDGLYVGTDGGGVFCIDTATATITDHITHRLNHVGSPASNQVYSVMADNSGLLWIGYYQHGADYSINNSGVFEVFNDPDVFNSRGIAIRTITHDGPFRALGTRDGLILIDSLSGVTTLRRPALNSDMVIAVKEYRDRLYIGTYGGGMSVYDPVTRRVNKFDPHNEIPFNRGHVFSIAVDSGDRLWLGTSNGLYCYDGTTLLHHFTSTNSVMPVGNVYEVIFDSRSRGWICTENGMCIYDPSTGTLRKDIFPAGFVNNDKIRTIYEDSDHNLYFLPERGKITVSSLDLDNVTRLNFPALDGADAKSIAEDANGYVWITTNRGIVRWNKKDEILKFGIADGLPSAQFIQCTPAVERDKGQMWFGNSNGLIKLDTNRDPHNNATDRHLLPTYVTADGNDDNVAVISRIDSTHYKITLDRFCANLTIDFSPFTFTSPDAITYEYSVDGSNWQPIPYSMKVDIYNNFTVHDIELRVRPEGNRRLVTDVYVDMPMSFALKAIIGLGFIALLLIIYAIYVSLVHLKNKYAARRAAMLQPEVDDDPEAEADKPKYRSNPLNDADCARIMKLVDTVMDRDKLYTDPDLKISQLAAHAGISSHKLSQVFNQYVNKKFYDYVNMYRVKEFKKIASRGGASRYTLTAMAEKAGFSSRASFFRHFKDVEGISPGEFLKQLKK